MNPRSAFLAVAAALVIGVGAGFAAHSLTGSKSASPVETTNTVPTNPVSSTTSTNTLTQIYAKDAPGVVTVTVSGRSNSSPSSIFPGSQKFEAMGTGFEIDSNGNIMTAEHVVSGATTITVTLQEGS